MGIPENARVTQHFRPLLGPNLPVLLRKPGQYLNPCFDTRRIHPIGLCTTESFKGKLKTSDGMCHYTQCRLRLSGFCLCFTLYLCRVAKSHFHSGGQARIGRPKGLGLGHRLLVQFSSHGSSKAETSETDFFHFVNIQNDKTSYAKHVLDPRCVFFTLFFCRGGCPKVVGAQLAYAIFHSRQLENGNFQNRFF